MKHTMKLYPRYFHMMRVGIKVVEYRRWDEKRRRIIPGDIIEFREEGTAETEVRAVTRMVIHRNIDELVRFEQTIPDDLMASYVDFENELRTIYGDGDFPMVALYLRRK